MCDSRWALITAATAPYIMIYYLECSNICFLYGRQTLMFHHLASEACQCSSITSAFCLSLQVTWSHWRQHTLTLTHTHTHTHTHVCRLPLCPFLCLLVCFSAALYFSLLLLWETHTHTQCVTCTHTHTHTHTHTQVPDKDRMFWLWLYLLRVFNGESLMLHTLWKPEQTCFSFYFLQFSRQWRCALVCLGLHAPVAVSSAHFVPVQLIISTNKLIEVQPQWRS